MSGMSHRVLTSLGSLTLFPLELLEGHEELDSDYSKSPRAVDEGPGLMCYYSHVFKRAVT